MSPFPDVRQEVEEGCLLDRPVTVPIACEQSRLPHHATNNLVGGVELDSLHMVTERVVGNVPGKALWAFQHRDSRLDGSRDDRCERDQL